MKLPGEGAFKSIKVRGVGKPYCEVTLKPKEEEPLLEFVLGDLLLQNNWTTGGFYIRKIGSYDYRIEKWCYKQ